MPEELEPIRVAKPSDHDEVTETLWAAFGGDPVWTWARGIGMALLAENLARIDCEHMPAYLESTNPAKIARYERVDFTRHGEFSTPDGSHTVTTMWREAR